MIEERNEDRPRTGTGTNLKRCAPSGKATPVATGFPPPSRVRSQMANSFPNTAPMLQGKGDSTPACPR